MKHSRLAVTAALCLLCLTPSARADAVSDFKYDSEKWSERAKALYALNTEALAKIWEAYCGLFDPSLPASLKSATEIGLSLQNEQIDKLKGLKGDLRTLRDRADTLKKATETTSDQKTSLDSLLDELAKIERNLEKLDKGVILSGSNHPFVKLSLEYGKKKHLELCDYYDGDVNVCDQNFPTLGDDRPDLVMANSYGLWVLEFKPDNSDAKSKGWDKLPNYAKGVVAYYQKFFPKGPLEPTEGVPEDKLGGQKMLDYLAKTKSAWDGTTLKVNLDLKTYSMCDKPYDELR